MISMLAGAGLKLIEGELVKHSPEIQAFILNELKILGQDVIDLVARKIKEKEAQNGG